MRKKVWCLLLLAVAAVVLLGCQQKTGEEVSPSQTSQEENNPQGELSDSPGTEENPSQELAALAQDGEYSLIEAALLPDSQLLLFYNNAGEYQFKIYDLAAKRITQASDPIQLSRVYGGTQKLQILSDHFYILTQDGCFVYDFSCRLIKQEALPIPEEETMFSVTYGMSNDLERVVYVKRTEEGSHGVFLSNCDGSGESLLEVDIAGASNLFFSTDNSCLGIEGQVFPQGEDLSVDAYGYMDLRTGELWVQEEEDTVVSHVGDMMLIQDKEGLYGSEKKGKVRLLDLKTREVQEIVMKYPDECVRTSLALVPEYMVGMHSDEKANAFSFTIYKNGEELTSVPYTCDSQQLFIDIITIDTKMELDVGTKQILLCYYDTEAGCYTVKTISYDR